MDGRNPGLEESAEHHLLLKLELTTRTVVFLPSGEVVAGGGRVSPVATMEGELQRLPPGALRALETAA